MKQPPRSRDERLLSWPLLGMSYGIIGMLQAAAGFFAFFVVLHQGGWEWGDALPVVGTLYKTAVTSFFAAVVICQIANVLICRTRRQSILSAGIFANKLIWAGIAVGTRTGGRDFSCPVAAAIFRNGADRLVRSVARLAIRRCDPAGGRIPALDDPAGKSLCATLAHLVASAGLYV